MVSVQFCKNFKGTVILWWGRPKNFDILSDISFDSGSHKIVLSSLVLFSCDCYWFDLGETQWNEVPTLTDSNQQ